MFRSRFLTIQIFFFLRGRAARMIRCETSDSRAIDDDCFYVRPITWHSLST